MSLERVVEPEWLDLLPPGDVRAQRSRADLRRINFLMGNARHIARALAPLFCDPPLSRAHAPRIADLGAGDGSVMRGVLRHLKMEADVTLVDRALEAVPWQASVAREDAHAFLARPGPGFDAMVANLFLHHFERDALRSLLEAAARRTRLFVACEPRRSRFALAASGLSGLIGCNGVTRHDAKVSVRAGFRGAELSQLWPRAPGWRLCERAAPPFSHLFIACRDAPL